MKCVLLLFGLMLTFSVQGQGQIPINLLSFFSLTSEQSNGDRIIDESALFAFVHAFALAERMRGTTGQFEALPGLIKEYTCDVNFQFSLRDTKADFTVALQDLATQDLTNFDLVLGPTRSSVCVPVSFVTSTFLLPVFSPSCTTPELDDTLVHRFFARTIPSDEATALAMIELLKSLPTGDREPELKQFSADISKVYNRVAVLYQEDTYGSNFKDSLFENVVDDDITFIFVPFTPGNEQSIRAAVGRIAATNLNVIFGLFFADDISTVTDEAIKLGIYTEDQVWIFSDGIVSAQEFKTGLEIGSNEPVSSAVFQAVNNSFLVQASGQVDSVLIEQFQEQAFNANFGYDLNALATVLNSQNDGDNQLFVDVLQRMQTHGEGGERIELTDFSLFAFDLILGIRDFIELKDCDIGNRIDAQEFISALESLEYDGVTGRVSFDSSQSRGSNNAAFKLINARFDNNNDPDDILVGNYDGIKWSFVDDEITFNNGGQQAPLVVDPPQNVELNLIPPEIKITIYILGAIVLFLACFAGVFTWLMGHRQVIKAAQPFFLLVMILGVIIGTVSVFIFPQDEDTGKKSLFKCNAPYFFISLGLTVSYGALILKLQRVVEVANETPDLVATPDVSNHKSFLHLGLLVLIEFIILGLTLLIAPLELEKRVVAVDNFGQPTEVFDICSPRGSVDGFIYSLYFIFHLCYYAYGFKLILKVKNLSTDFQEGKWIILSVVSQFQLYLLGIPVVIAVGVEDPGVRFLIIGLLVLFSNAILLALIFGPKFIRIINGDDNVVWRTSYAKRIESEPTEYEDNSAEKEVEKFADLYRKSLSYSMKTDDFGL